MSIQRQHGGAALQHFPLNLPGFKGLNTQARGAVLGPEWATRMENTILDSSNRVASRKGWSISTTTPAGEDFVQIAEYFTAAGTAELIATGDSNTLYHSANDGATWSDVTSTAGVTDPNMQLQMFNDLMIGFQQDDSIVVYNGTNFSDLTVNSGTAPQGGVGLAAFGRLWAVDDDGVTIRVSAILDETRWSESDGGAILDTTSVWKGTDTVQALAEFNGALVVFGRRNILVWTDGQGSALGLDPVNLYVADTLTGIGCIARDSVVGVKGDLWFLDDTGVQSLGRLINERSNPLDNVSKNIQDDLREVVEQGNTANIRAVYSPQDRFYLLSIPLGTTTEQGSCYCFDTRGRMQDGSFRVSGVWNQLVPTAMVVRDNLDLLIALKEKQGEVGRYSGYLDEQDTYIVNFESGWTDLEQPTIKILKRVTGLMFVQSATDVTFKWAFDFDDNFKSASTIFPGGSAAAEWNVDEWDEGEFGGGVNISEKKVGGKGTGEYIKIGFTVEINSEEVSIQQLGLYAKQGRLR